MTQKERIITFLNDFKSITRAEAFAELGIVELPARICELEKMGFKFKKTIVKKKNRYGEDIHFTKYELEDDDAGIGEN